MTDAVADYEVATDLGGGDDDGRYLSPAPARLAPRDGQVVVHRLRWVDGPAWARLGPLLDAIHVAAAAQEHLVDLVEAGFDDGAGAWYVTGERSGPGVAEASPDLAAGLRAVGLAAEAVHALHELGVVHQGVGPGAISAGGTLDLPPIDRSRTSDGQVLAITSVPALDTVDPAWARGGQPSRETDLFALGATLYQVVTGRLLHPDLATDEPVVALQRVMFEPVHLPADLDADIAATVAACISPDPASRPPSARALSRHLLTLADRS